MLRRFGSPIAILFWSLFMLAPVRPAPGQDPFVISNAAKRTPTIDGNPSEWSSFGSDTLRMSWAHNERTGAPDSEPLVVDISYAWDDTNFYTLVQEVSDDDPTTGIDDVAWCNECNGPTIGDAAPWSTDSVGFYDKGIRWPNGEQDPILETGQYTQWWVGLTTADELEVDGQPQYRHLVRTVGEGRNEGGARLVGPRSEEHDTFLPLHEDMPELTAPQSAFSVVDGKRIVEFFMRWDQIRYDANDPRDTVQDRIEELLPGIEGHLLQDVKEGYEFRLDPLLVDGTEDYSFGGQTHPSGIEHPDQAIDFGDIAVVRLVGGGVTGDFNNDGMLNQPDIDDLTGQSASGQNPTNYDLNADTLVNEDDVGVWVKELFGSWIGDADLDHEFTSSDLVQVFASGTYDADIDAVWSTGDFNGDGRTDSADLVAAFTDGGYELGPPPAAVGIPEPATLTLLAVGASLLAFRRRRP